MLRRHVHPLSDGGSVGSHRAEGLLQLPQGDTHKLLDLQGGHRVHVCPSIPYPVRGDRDGTMGGVMEVEEARLESMNQRVSQDRDTHTFTQEL